MIRTQVKILFTLLALAFLGCVIAGSIYVYQKEFRKDNEARKELENQGDKPLPDPGRKKFAKSVEHLQAGDLETAQEGLLELVRLYKDSSKHSEAKRIIGEINMDALLEPRIGPGKKEYIVQRGDSLSLIANKNQSTLLCIKRTNGLFDTMIHPGDRLIVFPLDFSIVIDVEDKTLTLMRKERFFKEYPILEVKVPSSLRIPFQTSIASLSSERKWINLKSGVIVIASQRSDDNKPSYGIFLDPADFEELFTITRKSTPVKVVR